MKIAVTGATGFIGRYVVAELVKRSITPILISRSGGNLLSSGVDYSVVSLDVKNADPDSFERIGKPDLLIHLAWGHLPHYASLHHFEVELPNHYLFLKHLVEAGLKKLIVTGTCLEYGMQSGALSEDREARPITPYGYAKDALRRQLQFLQQSISFDLTWTRLFYLYGKGQAATSLLPQLKSAVERGDKFFKMSGGEQLRDYLPVTEVVKYLVTVALASRNVGIVNICSGQPISVRSLVEGWIKQNSWSIGLELGHQSYSKYEPMAFWGDNAKLESYQF